MTISEQAEVIAQRHAIPELLVRYWLAELELSPAVADILAQLADEGWEPDEVNEAAVTMVRKRRAGI